MSRFYPYDPESRKLQRAKLRKRALILFAILSALALLLFYLAMRWSGEWLVTNHETFPRGWVIVLEGQTADLERNDFVAELLMSEQVDSVVFMGNRVYRDQNNADFYVDDILQKGRINATRLFKFKHNDHSTLEQALSIVPAFKAKNVDTVVIVTSEASSSRVEKVFQQVAGNKPIFLAIGVKDPLFDPNLWLHNRDGRRIWFREWVANLTSKMDLWGLDSITMDSKKVKDLEPVQVALADPKMIPISLISNQPEAFDLPEELNSSSSTLNSSSSQELAKKDSVSNDELNQAEEKKEKAQGTTTAKSSTSKTIAKEKAKDKPKEKAKAKEKEKPKTKPTPKSTDKKTNTSKKSSSSAKNR